MTLILNLITADRCIQVSDRRLTMPKTGTLVDDAANKAISCFFGNGRACISYTGLAEIDGQRTDDWIWETMSDAKFDLQNCNDALKNLRDACTKKFRSAKNVKDRGLTLVISGFQNDRPFVAVITNRSGDRLETKGPIRNYFRDHICCPPHIDPKTFNRFLKVGDTDNIPESVNYKYRLLKKDRHLWTKSSENLVRDVVGWIRAAADSKYGYTIGKNCMSVAFSKKGPVSGRYHSFGGNSTTYGPHVVGDISFSHVRFWSGVGPAPDNWWKDGYEKDKK